jgi:PAB1-binding protein PBP1
MVGISKLAVALLVAAATAHPGESHDAQHMKREIVARDHAARAAARSLGSCANSEAARALKKRSVQRRAEVVKTLREKKGIKTRMPYFLPYHKPKGED